MSHVFLGWPNRIDAATLSGGSWSADLPLTNLQSRSMAVVARSADATNASTKILIDLGSAYSLKAFGLFNQNLSEAAQVRISLGTTSGGTEVYAGGWVDAFPVDFSTGADEWQDYNWWTPLSDDEFVRNPFSVIVGLSQFYSARYITIEIDDTSNTDGWVQIGRVFVGGGFQPVLNATYGMTDEWEPHTEIAVMESGARVAMNRRSARSVRLTFPRLNQATEFGVLHEMVRRLGLDGELLYCQNLANRIETQRTGFLASLKSMPSLAYTSYLTRSVACELIERL